MVKLFATIFFSFVSAICFSQISFLKIYTDNGFDKGEGIVQLTDSSYLVTGSSTSFTDGPPKAYMMRLDSLGNHLWSKYYGGSEINEGKRIFAIEDYGYYIGGNTNSNSTTDFNFSIIKTDTSGNVLFEKQAGTSAWDFVNDGILLADSTIILTGETYNTSDGVEDSYTIRFDKNGDTLWTMQSFKPGLDRIFAIENIGDTAFALAGTVWNIDSSMQKAFIGCYYLDKTPIWEKLYGEADDYVILDADYYIDRIQSVGYRINPIDNERDEYVLTVYADSGDVLSTFSFYGDSDKGNSKVVKYGSTNEFYVGYSFIDEFSVGSGEDFSLLKTDDFFSSSGISLQFLADGQDDLGQLIATNDGGALLIGTNRSFGNANGNVLAIKIGANDNFPNTSGIPILNSLVSIEDVPSFKFQNLMWPNPFKDEINIKLGSLENGRINIYSLTGDLVISKIINSGLTSIRLENYTGVFLVEFQKNGSRSFLGRISSH